MCLHDSVKRGEIASRLFVEPDPLQIGSKFLGRQRFMQHS